MGVHRQPQYCPVPSHLDVAPRWQSAGRGRRVSKHASRKLRTLRSGERHLVSNRQPQYRARFPYGNSPAQRQGARRGRKGNRPRSITTQRRSPLAAAWSSEESTPPLHSPPPNSTIRRPAPGHPPAASTAGERTIPQLCCPTAWCSWRGEPTSRSTLPNSTIRRPAPRHSPVASTPCERTMQQLSCSTGWCSSQVEHLPTRVLSRARNFMIRESWYLAKARSMAKATKLLSNLTRSSRIIGRPARSLSAILRLASR